MNLQKNEELNTLFEKLSVAEPGEGVVLLRRIESIGKNIPKTAEKLIPFLHHPDYLVRSRVFIALGRIKDTGISNLLLDYLASEPGEEWQLRVLECLYLLNDNKVIPRISFLLDQHASPLLTRGAAWLIGYLGGEEALHILLKFAVSPRGRIVKSEIILEAIALALKSWMQGMSIGLKLSVRIRRLIVILVIAGFLKLSSPGLVSILTLITCWIRQRPRALKLRNLRGFIIW